MDPLNFTNANAAQSTGIAVNAGFPNASNDTNLHALNLQQLLITRPVSTFLFRLRGDNWTRYGVFDSDIVIVDRALEPRPHDLAIWWQAKTGDFVLGRCRDVPAGASVWGCVTSIIHQLRSL